MSAAPILWSRWAAPFQVGDEVALTEKSSHPHAAVFDDVIGQRAAIDELTLAVRASRGDPDVPAAAMTHAWLFTGPPGSGRSVAARAFAAALQCTDAMPGCGHCAGCHQVHQGTHADLEVVRPSGLSY